MTEYRAGNYVYFDRTQVGLGAATFDDCALTVLATVVSKPAADRIILDCGSKTLAADGARGFSPLSGHGAVVPTVAINPGDRPDEDLIVERLSEEHATVRVAAGGTPLEPGDRVRVVPNHSCVVSNLVDQAWLIDGIGARAAADRRTREDHLGFRGANFGALGTLERWNIEWQRHPRPKPLTTSRRLARRWAWSKHAAWSA